MQVTNGKDRSSESLIAVVVVLVDPAEQQTVALWQPVPVVYWGDLIGQVGDITLFLLRCMILSRSRLPMRLCSLPTHSPGICMLEPIELSMAIMLGECMRDAWVRN